MIERLHINEIKTIEQKVQTKEEKEKEITKRKTMQVVKMILPLAIVIAVFFFIGRFRKGS